LGGGCREEDFLGMGCARNKSSLLLSFKKEDSFFFSMSGVVARVVADFTRPTGWCWGNGFGH
jgi:hypothetical protein